MTSRSAVISSSSAGPLTSVSLLMTSHTRQFSFSHTGRRNGWPCSRRATSPAALGSISASGSAT
ncbi:hypothetical protein [Actinomarinicola tropica]|uniref:Uncharacterized protein n=1 Tax=Actinomarinicola tropica TaxID=2789776 RepID=A0A5Q2RIX9_9ACTN|nr:hypothetical protein [Actinomarinicola tropica]QGG95753.1 hypothetical protein GH723_11970 [Actinomarinicola tropica]